MTSPSRRSWRPIAAPAAGQLLGQGPGACTAAEADRQCPQPTVARPGGGQVRSR